MIIKASKKKYQNNVLVFCMSFKAKKNNKYDNIMSIYIYKFYK